MNVQDLNPGTQPSLTHKIFNNPEVIPKAWYFAMRSSELKPNSIQPLEIGVQKIVVFRGASGRVFALDAFCPHMGTDLSIGKVIGDQLQCFFHHWQFTGQGACSKIPCQTSIPREAKLTSYATCERYGAIWVYPDATPAFPLMEIPDLEGKALLVRFAPKNYDNAHHHISMINGLDAQHLKTVHRLTMDMTIAVDENDQHMDFVLTGSTPHHSFAEKFFCFLLGPSYSYAMRYAQASLAALILFRNVYFLRPAWRWPPLYMIYAYRPLPDGRAMTQPIYLTAKRPGLIGFFASHLLITLTKLAYHFLKDDDHKIYNNIRFSTKLFLPMDAAIVRYIRYVDQLEPSVWSKSIPQHKGSTYVRSAVTRSPEASL